MGGTPRTHVVLRRVAYGPHGFTCECGGKKFVPEQAKVMVNRDSLIRRSHRCKKCRASYIFVSHVFSKEVTQ